ncbi:MAG: tRNA pseudouridine(55) synthase TruB [Candidatus Omnitrophota bacterium]|jgi:tRNA pseudouridine55 synthase
MKEGILVINKPGGMTSHDVVDFVRKRLKIRRVGHAGTLDPIATGVLLILVGRCTKLFNHFLNFDKEYLATLTLGKRTTSGDREGKVVETKEYNNVTDDKVKEIFGSYIGEILQVPPMVSALKYRGRRLYSLARRGIKVNRQPRSIMIKELSLRNFNLPYIKFYLKCSKGTYVRQLAEDIAQDLNCVGYISEIQRQSIGPFNIAGALSLSQIDESFLRPYPF